MIFLALLYSSWHYIDFVKSKRDSLAVLKHEAQAVAMQERVKSMILQKQKSTIAMALSLATDQHLAEDILNNKIEVDYYKNLIEKFQTNTLYKNIWIQILDKNITSLYRSWSTKRGDSLKNIREDLVSTALNKKVTYSISVGRFDLSIKAIVPLFFDGKFIGIVEIVSHFNSISQQLKASGIQSAVVLKKEYRQQLKYPFTKLFIDDYYVANFDVPKNIMSYLSERGVENYFISSYKLENGFIISSYELKDALGKPIAYYIMFKKIDTISSMDLEFFMFKWLAIGLIVIMSIAIVISTILFFTNRRQKAYYKYIIDSATNIVIINDIQEILNVNKIFFKYFDTYKSLEEFKEKHSCICDFFVNEETYLQKSMKGISWVEYLLNNLDFKHKVKIKIASKEYYFFIAASRILNETNHYSVILSDITVEENYKKKLEQLSVTDALTGIGNRRAFHHKMESEIKRANRYVHPVSLIMFDIDFFKDVNDKHGHSVGDEVLIEYTKLICSLLRECDVFCRIGGEEFMIILPHVTLDDTKKIAEKLREEIENYKKVVPITMSFGVVEYEEGDEIESLLKRVDDALYRAKESGRNGVVAG